MLFREEIALSFGFVTCVTDSGGGGVTGDANDARSFSTDHQYVHCTGNMFLLIPTQVQEHPSIQVG